METENKIEGFVSKYVANRVVVLALAILCIFLLFSKFQCGRTKYTSTAVSEKALSDSISKYAKRFSDSINVANKRFRDSAEKATAAANHSRDSLLIVVRQQDEKIKYSARRGGEAVVKNDIAKANKDTAAYKESTEELKTVVVQLQNDLDAKDEAHKMYVDYSDAIIGGLQSQIERDQADAAAKIKVRDDALASNSQTIAKLDSELKRVLKAANKEAKKGDKNLVFGPSAGYGLGADLKLQPVFGVSLTYKFLSFKL